MTNTVYTATGSLWMPENKITEVVPGHTYEPLRGYGSVMAVLDADGTCIGWILSETLGYPTVKDWMQATNNQP